MPDFAARRTAMVDTQIRPSDVTRFPIIDAFLRIPRERFVPDALREAAYAGDDLPLGEGRVILAPRTLAKMIEAIAPQRGDLVLDVGCGTGYAAAVLSRLAEAVVALEEDAELAAEAQAALAETASDNAVVVEGALAEGAARHGPYDAIIVEGAVERMPEALTDQLKEGGRIAAIFMEDRLGVVRLGSRWDGAVHWRHSFNAAAPVLSGFHKPTVFQF
jgi:protein-L-isoaspartate(D-aspartate) O-methyltransferase